MYLTNLGERVSFGALRTRYPQTSFPHDWPGGIVNGVAYARVLPTEAPEYDPVFHSVSEGAPQLVDDEYRQSWILSERPIDDVRADLHQMRREARTSAELAGFSFSGHPIDSDRDSILRIANAVSTAITATLSGTPFATMWHCADGHELRLDAEGVMAMQAALSAHGQACHTRSMALKDEIDAAATLDDLRLVDVGNGA